ncbi:MAG: hypothetical protein AAGU12_06635 [Clostridiales bacterium]
MGKHLVDEKEGFAEKAKSATLTLRRLNVERSYSIRRFNRLYELNLLSGDIGAQMSANVR